MNWKDHANLFANGKFKVKIDHYKHPVNFNVSWWDTIERDYEMDKCTLIARKIEDMTDEEIIDSLLFDCLKDKADPSYIRKMEVEKNSVLRSSRMFLYMLSIGVYPFDQSHFETGTVIDINTL